MTKTFRFDEVAVALEKWPPKIEEVFPLPLSLIQDYEDILDGDEALFDHEAMIVPPRYSYTVQDLDIYARVVRP